MTMRAIHKRATRARDLEGLEGQVVSCKNKMVQLQTHIDNLNSAIQADPDHPVADRTLMTNMVTKMNDPAIADFITYVTANF